MLDVSESYDIFILLQNGIEKSLQWIIFAFILGFVLYLFKVAISSFVETIAIVLNFITDLDDIFYQFLTSPIIKNNKVYGVIIFSYAISNQNADLGFISLNILIFFILFVLIMILMSFIFSRSLVSPIKKLSKLTILERERIDEEKIIYPNRDDEIGTLAKEIQNMSLGLKSQITQLEKFSADVSHEIKNPLTSLQTAFELINTNNISIDKKNLLIKNIYND